jgi:hypothetical protein
MTATAAPSDNGTAAPADQDVRDLLRSWAGGFESQAAACRRSARAAAEGLLRPDDPGRNAVDKSEAEALAESYAHDADACRRALEGGRDAAPGRWDCAAKYLREREESRRRGEEQSRRIDERVRHNREERERAARLGRLELDAREADAGWRLRRAARDAPAAPGYEFRPLTSPGFAAGDYRLTWLVKRLLVAKQPCILGAPKKNLKTTIAVDLALSLGTGRPFLGSFDVYKPARVGLVSGESGEATLQETARRVAAAKGVDLGDADVLWDFDLPALTSAADVAALCGGVAAHGVTVLLLDPLFLCMLSGDLAGRLEAANLYQMGPIFRRVARSLLAAGCTPVLLHHAPKHVPAGEPLELDQLAFAGVSEFARQWLLVNRRVAYDPNRPGSHQLWLGVGGSCGQSGLWALDVEEGELREDFTGRRWEVAVRPATEARQEVAEEREDARERAGAQKRERDATKVLLHLDEHDPQREGLTRRQLRDGLNWGDARIGRATQRLLDQRILEECQVCQPFGHGEKKVAGVRRPPR